MTERDFLAETLADIMASTTNHGSDVFDARAWDTLEAAGMTHIALPEALGGGEGDLVQAATVVRLAGIHAISAPVAECCLQADLLLAAAGLRAPTGVTSCASTDAVDVVSTADGLSLSGVLRRVPYARVADTVVVLIEEAGRHRVVLVPREACSVVRHDNVAGEPRDDLLLTDVVVPVHRVGEVPPGTADELQLRVALSQVLALAGAAEHVQALTLRHIREREQFGRPLSRFQVVQHAVAELSGEATTLGVGAHAALLSVAEHSPHRRLAVASAALNAGVAAGRVARIAHQLHGAMGLTAEHALHRWTRRLWAWRYEDPSEAFWSSVIARNALSPNEPPVWLQLIGAREPSNG